MNIWEVLSMCTATELYLYLHIDGLMYVFFAIDISMFRVVYPVVQAIQNYDFLMVTIFILSYLMTTWHADVFMQFIRLDI